MSRTIIKGWVVILMMAAAIACNQDSKKDDKSKSSLSAPANTPGKNDDPGDPKATGSQSKEVNTGKGATHWKANRYSARISFKVKGPFGTVDGTLGGLKSSIFFDKSKLNASSIEASTDTKSINTGIKLRNNDLQKEKYLDADSYPIITFRSHKIEKAGDAFRAVGDLTIKGVTRPVTIPFDFKQNGNEGVFRGDFSIRRQDFKIGKPGGSIGKMVKVHLQVPVTKAV